MVASDQAQKLISVGMQTIFDPSPARRDGHLHGLQRFNQKKQPFQ